MKKFDDEKFDDEKFDDEKSEMSRLSLFFLNTSPKFKMQGLYFFF